MKRSYPDKYKTDQIPSFGNEDSQFLKQQQEMKMKTKMKEEVAIQSNFKRTESSSYSRRQRKRLKSFEKVSKKNKNRYTNA